MKYQVCLRKIVKSIIWVDDAIISVDKDGSVCKSIELVKPDIFANGGDRKNKEIPESKICNKLGIKIIDGIGKKIRSSSNYTGLKSK